MIVGCAAVPVPVPNPPFPQEDPDPPVPGDEEEDPPQPDPGNCRDVFPTAMDCDDEYFSPQEAAEDWLRRNVGGPVTSSDIGACEPNSEWFNPGACLGAPGFAIHCDVPRARRGYVSVFQCVCCNEDGSVGTSWAGPH